MKEVKDSLKKFGLKKIDGSYDDTLRFLSEILEGIYNEKVIILIDEYDVPLTTAYEYGFYDKAVIFFKNLYGACLKTNSSLKMGVLTGAIKVASMEYFLTLIILKLIQYLMKHMMNILDF